MYNLDVFEYRLDSHASLYGAIPFIMSHGLVPEVDPNRKTGLMGILSGKSTTPRHARTHGYFFNNAAEMFLDVLTHEGRDSLVSAGIRDKVMNQLKSKSENLDLMEFMSNDGVVTHWMAESGVIDLFVFAGKDPYSVLDGYTSLTGRPSMPPMFALGYHQCRWNYKDEKDVHDVCACLYGCII